MLALMVDTHGAHTNHTQEGLFLVEALGTRDSHFPPTQSGGGARLEAALEKSAMSPERVEAKVGQCRAAA